MHFYWPLRASLLYRPERSGFAPLYDLMCAAAHPDIHAKLAMKIAKRATLEVFTPTTWDEFAMQIGMSAPYVRRRASALSELILTHIEGVAGEIAAAGFDGPGLHQIVDMIRHRAQRLIASGTVKATSGRAWLQTATADRSAGTISSRSGRSGGDRRFRKRKLSDREAEHDRGFQRIWLRRRTPVKPQQHPRPHRGAVSASRAIGNRANSLGWMNSARYQGWVRGSKICLSQSST